MKTYFPADLPTAQLHQYLVGAVAPRPIAFASTIDENGNPNLAPYSFFNVFSSNPPMMVFSSNRRVSDNTTKDTLHNIEKTGEVVINVVNHAIVRQMAVASVQFDTGVNEFTKSGLTPIPSDEIKPFRVAESPVHFECKVQEIKPLGEQGGAGHLIICEIVKLHISEDILDEESRIDPHKIDLVGRLGRAFYSRASGDAVFKVFQPVPKLVIGYDALPDFIKNSEVLTGNNLGQIAGLFEMPTLEDKSDILKNKDVQKLMRSDNVKIELHRFAKAELEKENTIFATQVLLFAETHD
jgi:flavin reductase (DIM6/NTAB) family NADH-FMN oxidoreductase RutF